MHIGVHTFFLGLGLFFVGLLMTGERMRHLAGSAFHRVAARVASPFFGGLVGTAFGSLMQSATAVTFILVSMVRTGLMTAPVALPIILWANVGLTALSFVATLNIHTAVSWIVGLAGVTMGLLKVRRIVPWAGLVFGISLILFGLQTMGDGAAPLKDAPAFQRVLEMTTSSPGLAFLVGMVAATILQSNVGTVLLVVTLAGAGALSLQTSAMIIYGSNLGAIFLRIFLSLGMDRASFRLVRFEDFFCIWSGIVMVGLYALEMAGMPLVLAFIKHITSSMNFQLAGIFLLSNLIPALLLHPWRNKALAMLARVWPGEFPEDHSRPKFLDNTALDHPPTAIGLVQKELTRLLTKVHARCDEPKHAGDIEDFQPSQDFTKLSIAIDQFLSELVSKSELNRGTARAAQLQRAELSMIRYLAEAVGQFSQYATQVTTISTLRTPATQMIARINVLIELAVSSAGELSEEKIGPFFEESAKKNPANISLRDALHSPAGSTDNDAAPSAEAVRENFSTALWILHRFARLLRRGAQELTLR